MKNSALSFTKSDPRISVSELERQAEGWLLAGDIDQHSPATLTIRRDLIHKLVWFLRYKEFDGCGVMELRHFFAYITHGHKEPGGRWGNPRLTNPVRPRTVHTYHGHLRTMFRWLVSEGVLEASPMERIPVPTSRADQIQPFTPGQVEALIAAAKRSRQSRRDEALVLFMLDTGLRASEVCAITMRDVDTSGRRCTVLGKGNKHRAVFFGKLTARALWMYLKEEPREPSDPLFVSERHEPLTRSGLRQLVERLGEAAKIEATRCSPHTFRHTFAVEFLRAGGNVFSLQQMLGHTSLHMTNKYVALAQADIENQHRQYSPVERLRRGKK